MLFPAIFLTLSVLPVGTFLFRYKQKLLRQRLLKYSLRRNSRQLRLDLEHLQIKDHRGQAPNFHGVKTLLGDGHTSATFVIMNLLILLIVLMLLFGGGGFYLGGPMVGGSGFGLILLVLLVLFFTGRLGRR